MTRTTRRVLFYCAIIIFIGVSYIVLLYAQGYKYDFSKKDFVRTGAIYVDVNTDAHVLIDGKKMAETSLLGNSASVGGLLPGAHSLSVQREGYSLWQKKVTVVAGFVEDFTRIMILPQTGRDKEIIKKEIQDLLYTPVPSPSPTVSASPKKTPRPTTTPSPTPSATPDPDQPYYLDSGSLFVRTEDGPVRIAGDKVKRAFLSEDKHKLAWFSEGQIWVYWFSDTNYQPLRHAGDIALVARFNQPILAAEWFKDSDHIALDAGGLKVIEIDTRPSLNIINF